MYGEYRYERKSILYDRKGLNGLVQIYCKEEYKTMSSVLANYILQLKRGAEKPKNLLYSNQTKR